MVQGILIFSKAVPLINKLSYNYELGNYNAACLLYGKILYAFYNDICFTMHLLFSRNYVIFRTKLM